MGLNDRNNIEANTDDIVQKSNDLIIKVNNLHASNQNENTLVFRNKFQNENESEYSKAIEIHNLPKLNDLYINYKLHSTIKKSSIFVLVLKIIWYILICLWYYMDIIVDVYTCYRFYSQSNMIYFWLTLLFILLPNFLFSIHGFLNEFGNKWILQFVLFNLLGYGTPMVGAYLHIRDLIISHKSTNHLFECMHLNKDQLEISRNSFKRAIIKERHSLNQFKMFNLSEMIGETIPQLFLQFYVLFESGLFESNNSIPIIRIISSTSGILVSCASSSLFVEYCYNDYIRFYLPKLHRLDFKFILLRFITNLLFLTSLLISIITALLVAKIIVIISVLFYFICCGFYFYFIIRLRIKDFETYFEKKIENNLTIIFIVFKSCFFYHDFGKLRSLTNRLITKIEIFYCYISYLIVWFFIIFWSFLFYFYFEYETFIIKIDYWYFSSRTDIIDLSYFLNNSYFKIGVFIISTSSFMIAFLMEIIIIKKLFNVFPKNSYLFDYQNIIKEYF